MLRKVDQRDKKKRSRLINFDIKRKMKSTAHILFESFQDASTLFTVIRWIKEKKYYIIDTMFL